MMGGYNQGWSGWMLVAMVLLWPIVVGVAVWAVASLTRGSSAPARVRETPRQILDRRLAAGEIDAAHYHRTRALLDNGSMNEPTGAGSR